MVTVALEWFIPLYHKHFIFIYPRTANISGILIGKFVIKSIIVLSAQLKMTYQINTTAKSINMKN